MYSDDLDSVTNNLRDSAKGSNDGYNVAFPLTRKISAQRVVARRSDPREDRRR